MAFNDEVAICLKMLAARGGALDLKAVQVIFALQHLLDQRAEELAARVERLEAGVSRETPSKADDQLKSILASTHTILSDALERVTGFSTAHNVIDLAHILVAEWRGACKELDQLRDEKLAHDGFKPRMRFLDGSHVSWVEFDTNATRALIRDALGMDRTVEPLKEGELHTLASKLHQAFTTMQVEMRGAERELHEVVQKLEFVARDQDDLTPFLVADAAAEEIRKHRSCGRPTLTIGGDKGEHITIELPNGLLEPGSIHHVSLVGGTVTITTIAALPPQRYDRAIDFRTVNSGGMYFTRIDDGSGDVLTSTSLRDDIAAEMRKVLNEQPDALAKFVSRETGEGTDG